MYYATEPEQIAPKKVDPFAVAAGLLKNDLPILVPLFLVLAGTGVAQTVYGASTFGEVFKLQLLERVVQLAVLVFVVFRWRNRLSKKDQARQPRLSASLHVFIIGLLVWGALMSPTFLLFFAKATPLGFPLIMLFVGGIFLWFRFYFYFLVYGLLGTSLVRGISQTLEVGRRSPLAAVRSLIAPMAITSLLVWIVALPSPDGRSIGWAAVGAAVQGTFWLLSIYTGLGLGLTLIDDHEWRSARLDVYRKERLETLETQGRGSWLNILSPAKGVKIFILAVCLMTVSIYQAMHSKPAASIHVVSCVAQDQMLKVALNVQDSEYHFRGFNPIAFSIASQTGYPVSTELARVSREAQGEKGVRVIDIELSDDGSPVTLYLEFTTNKRDDVLRGMDNMWLWYNKVPIAPLKVEAVAPSPPGQQAPETAGVNPRTT